MADETPSLDSVFCAAVEIASAEERAAYVARACGDDAGLRQRVEELVAAHFRAGTFLESPPVDLGESLEEGTEREPTGESVAPAGEGDAPSLRLLGPPTRPGSLGQLGHYEVLEVIGRGGMGVVFRAFDEKLQRVVAIKVMSPGLAGSGTARQRFVREARAAAAVTHENVIDIHAVEDQGPVPYLVMQFVDGVSLEDRIRAAGALSLQEVLRIGLQTAAGLAAAHAQGLVHRDVKPANILLENSVERVKITDFGLARAVDEARLTQSGVVAGTPMYMSPEQAQGLAVDQRSDLFSLGSVLYCMCTGRPPFRAESALAVLRRVCEDTPRPVREINPALPEWLAALVDKLQAKGPADRFRSAAEVTELLGKHLAGLQHPAAVPLPPPAPSPARDTGRRRRGWRVAALLVLLLCGGLAVLEATGVTRLLATLFGGRPPGWNVSDLASGTGTADAKRPLADPEPRPFAIVARDGKGEQKFGTLAEAVRIARSGDTIEIQGNGPFVSQPIRILNAALTIRAGQGSRPVIKLDPLGNPDDGQWLSTNVALVLEGLEFHDDGRRFKAPAFPRDYPSIVASRQAPLYVANCRFLLGDRGGITQWGGPNCQIRNCELLGMNWHSLSHGLDDRARIGLDNNILVNRDSGQPTFFVTRRGEDGLIRLTRNLILGRSGWQFACSANRDRPEGPAKLPKRPIQVELSANILDVEGCAVQIHLSEADRLQPDEAKPLLRRLYRWQQHQDSYSLRGKSLAGQVRGQRTTGDNFTLAQFESLTAWRELWGLPGDAVLQGPVRYQGGDLRARFAGASHQFTTADVRLHPDSAGYCAGPDGKDLGPDIDLVGPGAAYERWKKTPEYQQWLKRTREGK